MEIYLKIGTMPALLYHVCRKRKLPEVGDIIEVKTENKPWVKAESIIIDDIRFVHGRMLFAAARW